MLVLPSGDATKIMDRGKNLKASKPKPFGFSGDLIALGSKPGRSTENVDAKGKVAATAVPGSSGLKKEPNVAPGSGNISKTDSLLLCDL